MWSSLFERCFWDVYKESKEKGFPAVQFSDVDKLVLEKAQMNLSDLMKYLELKREDLVNL